MHRFLVMIVFALGALQPASAQTPTTIRLLKYPVNGSLGARLLEIFKTETQKQVSKLVVFQELSPPNNPLGIIEALRNGDADIAVVTTLTLGQFDTGFRVFELPFLFEDLGSVSRFQAGEGGQILKSRLRKQDLEALAFVHNSMSVIVSKYVVHTPDDLKGRKFTSLAFDGFARNQFSALGATLIVAQPTTIVPMINAGAVDGFVGPFAGLSVNESSRINGYLTNSRHSYFGFVLLARWSMLEEMPANLRDAVATAAGTAQSRVNKEAIARIADATEQFRKAGIRSVSLKGDDMSKWRESMTPTWNRFDSSIGLQLSHIALAYGTGGGGDPCPILSECRCDNRACSVSCCNKR